LDKHSLSSLPLSEKAGQLYASIPDIPIRDDVVAPIDALRFVPGDLHGRFPRDTGVFHVLHRRAT